MIDIVPQLRALAANDPHADPAWAEAAADEIEWLRGERNRLAADLAKAHLDIVVWIKKAQEAYRD